MKTLSLLIFSIVILGIKCFAQQSVGPNQNFGNFALNDSTNQQILFSYSVIFSSTQTLTIEIKRTTDIVDPSKVSSNTSDLPPITVFNFLSSQAVFTTAFDNRIKVLAPNVTHTSANDEALILFGQFKQQFSEPEDAPRTAYLKLLTSHLKVEITPADSPSPEERKDDTASFFLNTGLPQKHYLVEVQVSQVDIEFEDGTIKNVLVGLKPSNGQPLSSLDNGVVIFRNTVPLGISGKFSPELLKNMILLAYDPCRAGNILDPSHQAYRCNFDAVEFKLSDLIDYRILLDLAKEDYSPVNQVVSLTPTENAVILKKEIRSKLFEVRTYTDLIGLDGNQPNGLIQIEGRKKFFIHEGRNRLSKYIYWGQVDYIEPVVRFSKLEANNRNLLPDTIGSAEYYKKLNQKVLNVQTIDLYKYQQQSLTININIFNFSFTQLKFNFAIDGKAGLYRTGISDSLGIRNGTLVKTDKSSVRVVNTALYGLNFIIKFLPDSRYGASIAYSFFGNRMMNANYRQNRVGGICTYWLDGYFKSSDSSTIFLRASYNYQNNNRNLNFAQAQVGATFDIFKANAK